MITAIFLVFFFTILFPFQVFEFAKEGRILEKSPKCPTEMYEEVMLKCWQINPKLRVSPTDLEAKLWDMWKTEAENVKSTADALGNPIYCNSD